MDEMFDLVPWITEWLRAAVDGDTAVVGLLHRAMGVDVTGGQGDVVRLLKATGADR